MKTDPFSVHAATKELDETWPSLTEEERIELIDTLITLNKGNADTPEIKRLKEIGASWHQKHPQSQRRPTEEIVANVKALAAKQAKLRGKAKRECQIKIGRLMIELHQRWLVGEFGEPDITGEDIALHNGHLSSEVGNA